MKIKEAIVSGYIFTIGGYFEISVLKIWRVAYMKCLHALVGIYAKLRRG